MATESLVIRRHVRFTNSQRGRRGLRADAPATLQASQPVPRSSRLMALAIVLDEMVRSGNVTSFAELAALAHVSPPRLVQIMSLTRLAPDIQEVLLFLPAVSNSSEPIKERALRPLLSKDDWDDQRDAWTRLQASL